MTPEQEAFLNEARYLWICMVSYANDTSGVFPENLKELLAMDWSLDESLLYQNPEKMGNSRVEKWIYSNTSHRKGTTSDSDEVLFSSTYGPKGAVVVFFVDGRFALLTKDGKTIKSGGIGDIPHKAPVHNRKYPRLVVIVGNERLSYYNSWKAHEVIEQVKNLATPIILEQDKPFGMIRFLSGTMTSPDSRKSSREIYLQHNRAGQWDFMEWRPNPPHSKLGDYHRHDNRTFPTPEKAVEWYIEEYLKPLL